MNMLQIGVLDEQKRMAHVLESLAIKSLGQLPAAEKSMMKRLEEFLRKVGVINLTIIGASDLPRMDLIRSCDPYCVTYVDGSGEPETYVTETFSKEPNPKWNQAFSWDMYSDTNFLTISVWDRDNVSSACNPGGCPPLPLLTFRSPGHQGRLDRHCHRRSQGVGCFQERN